MMFFYKIIGLLLYFTVYPYGRIKAAIGDPLWRGRLGFVNNLTPQNIWLHAASVGEVKIIGFLVNYLLEKKPSLDIFLTVMTRTGYNTAVSTLGTKVTVSFCPFDVLHLMRKTLSTVRPDLIVIAETEIWPNFIRESSSKHIPVILINGRMSEKAFKKYKLFKPFFRNLLSQYEQFFFKTDGDKKRYLYFGISENRTAITGDMKFDAPLPDRSEELISRIRLKIGVKRENFMLVAGSTRPGEEAILLDIYNRMRNKYDNLALVLVPRHLERVAEIKELLAKFDISYNIYNGQTLTGAGKLSETKAQPSLILIDGMGLLNELYLAADLAFVGGTLVPIGGHNLLEPVWAGTPVIYGTSLDNVQEAAEYIESGQYGTRVNNAAELEQVIEEIYLGKLKFAVKTDSDLQKTATIRIGQYILERINHA